MEVVRKVERLVKQTKNICFFAITLNYSKQTQLIIDTAWINRVEVLKTRNKEGKNKIELGNIVNDK